MRHAAAPNNCIGAEHAEEDCSTRFPLRCMPPCMRMNSNRIPHELPPSCPGMHMSVCMG